MRQFIQLLFVISLLCGCSSEEGSTQSSQADSEQVKSEQAKVTVKGPFPKMITGTVTHWEDSGDGKGTVLVFLKEFNGAMLVLPEDPDNPGRVEQAGTRVSFEVDTLSGERCGGSKMQCLSAK